MFIQSDKKRKNRSRILVLIRVFEVVLKRTMIYLLIVLKNIMIYLFEKFEYIFIMVDYYLTWKNFVLESEK